jgi:hypothetical protein
LDNLGNEREEKEEQKRYVKANIDERETNGKIKNIRDLYKAICDIKKGHQPGTNTVKDEKYDLVTDFCSITRLPLSLRWLLKAKKPKSPGIDQIPADLIKAGKEQFALKSIKLLILVAIRRNCLGSARRLSLYLYTG